MLAKNTKKTGKDGELIALSYLKNAGYRILETNINFSNQEIDIIAKKKNLYYIVEVKTSSAQSFSEPEDYVNKSKLRNLKKAAYSFSRFRNLSLEDIYIDLLAIKLQDNQNLPLINHYKNIC